MSQSTAAQRPIESAPKPVRPSREHTNLWSGTPLLRAAGRGYQGQVIIEAWADGRVLSVMKGSRPAQGGVPTGMVSAALRALEGSRSVRNTRVSLPDSPMSGGHPAGAEFLGRVIVEFWASGPIIAVLGANEQQLRDLALRYLMSMNRPPE